MFQDGYSVNILTHIYFVGSVYVVLKDSIYEASTPFRHMAELHHILQSVSFNKPVLFVFSDGGPDHRLTYISVKLSLICLFLKLDLDYLCAGRTAPYHSWRNPVERVMSVLNLGLQCVGLARAQLSEEFEIEVSKCNNLSELRRHLSEMKSAVQETLSPVKTLLHSIFCRLKMHDEFIHTFQSATSSELSAFWSSIIALDATLDEKGIYRKETINQHQRVVEFISHCCQSSHYTFDILKCGREDCNFCTEVRLPRSVFEKLRHIPHPTPGIDGHYLSFSDVFNSVTTEEHRPSFKKSATSKSRVKRKLPFYASVQHVRNSQLIVQCVECNMWRIIFAKYKLSQHQRNYLQLILDDHMYTCGTSLSELNLPEEYNYVEIRDHDCYDPIERLYYSAKNEPICIYCGECQPYTSDNQYPQCDDCSDKPALLKK